MKAAFTLLELLCAIAVLALLAAIAVPAGSRARLYAARTKSVSNLRQLGVAARLYANEHNQALPGQSPVSDLPPLPVGSADTAHRWPRLLCDYLSPSDPQVLVDPLDPAAAKLASEQILSDTENHTGYIYNGFDELARNGVPLEQVPLADIDAAVNVVLMSEKTPGSKNFYVDLLSSPLDRLLSDFNPAAFDGGSNYLYLDGSVRYLRRDEYSNNVWLVNKDTPLPAPGHPRRRYANAALGGGVLLALGGMR